MNSGIRRVGLVMVFLFLALIAQLTYLQVARSDKLARRARQPRADSARRDRGPILSADGAILADSVHTTDEFRYLRVYPKETAQLFSQIVGYESLRLGSSGVEYTYSADLAGKTFKLQAHSLADLLATKQVVGTVVLTASKTAQKAAADALAGRLGSVVVLDVQTGGIVAAYSNPAFDPNLLVTHNPVKAQTAKSLMLLDPTKPLLAHAWPELYAPGSTFKTVTASIAIQHNVDVNKVFPFVTHIPLPQTNGQSLYNFGGERCGGTLLNSFIVSCNTTFAQVGFDLGDTFAAGIQNFGVQTAPPAEIGSGIYPPIVQSTGPDVGTFQQNQPAFMQDAIGQNQVAVTPLQMALVAEAIATGGTILQPHVVDCVLDPNDDVVSRVPVQQYKRAIDPATAATMTNFMLQVVNDPRGTGTAAQIPGVQVAGKTGTAQTADGQKPHAWFIAFAPADKPRYAVAVLVEHGGGTGTDAEVTGGRVAAPIAKQVLQTLLSTPAPPSRCGDAQPGSSTNGR